jgi:antitoxin MazE
MRIDIVQIGNSKGIRLPKSVLDICHFEDAVDLEIKQGMVILHSLQKKPRKDWDKVFKQMAIACDDRLLDQPYPTEWDESEWKW